MRRLALVMVGVALVTAPVDDAGAAVDDGPCPAGTYAWLPAGADYEGGVWSVDGVAFGTAEHEDECWTPVADWVTATPAPEAPRWTLPATR